MRGTMTPPGAVRTTPRRKAPLWAVQGVTFLSSLGTGVVVNGVFFLATSACGFTESMNFGLGVLLGVTYILGAAGVGPALRRLAARSSAVSTRGVLMGLSASMGAAAMIPQIASWLTGDPSKVGWSIWLAVALYSPMSGAFWPIIESYLSGGRSGDRLRRAIGQFNIVWAVAVLLALWAMGPVMKHQPLTSLLGFGILQMLAVALVWPMGSEPGEHVQEGHDPHPPVYIPLLTTFRLLLPTSYYLVSIWSPYAPALLDRLGVPIEWQTGVAATWMLTRLGVFAAMERWHGWQGRWSTVVVGIVGVVGGIGIALAAPSLGGPLALVGVVVGLGVLGLGNGVIYTAALYYALEVGRGKVEAGGTHEALIGIGFAGGPATGLLAVGLIGLGVFPGIGLNLVMLGFLGVVLVGVAAIVARRVWRAAQEAGVIGGA